MIHSPIKHPQLWRSHCNSRSIALFKKKSGVIFWTGSLGGIAGEVGGAAYCASKFALEGKWSNYLRRIWTAIYIGIAESPKLETEPFGVMSHLFQIGHSVLSC